jgi:hypothetical protein
MTTTTTRRRGRRNEPKKRSHFDIGRARGREGGRRTAILTLGGMSRVLFFPHRERRWDGDGMEREREREREEIQITNKQLTLNLT